MISSKGHVLSGKLGNMSIDDGNLGKLDFQIHICLHLYLAARTYMDMIYIYIYIAYMPHEYLIVIVIPGGNKHIFDTINQWWWTNMFPHTFWQDLVGWIFTSERCPGHIPGMEK